MRELCVFVLMFVGCSSGQTGETSADCTPFVDSCIDLDCGEGRYLSECGAPQDGCLPIPQCNVGDRLAYCCGPGVTGCVDDQGTWPGISRDHCGTGGELCSDCGDGACSNGRCVPECREWFDCMVDDPTVWGVCDQMSKCTFD